MALSTRKKNLIIADHKAGRFETQTALLKHYKIDRKTLVKVLEGISSTHAEIVEAGVVYESAKKSLKNPVEIKAIENVVKQRTIADDIKDEVLIGTLRNVKSISKKVESEQVESMQDHKHAQDAFDKALITAGAADRHAPKSDTNIAVQTNVQNNIELTEAQMQEELIKRGIPLDLIGH